MGNQELAVIEQPTELVNVAKESGVEITVAESITLKYVPFLQKVREAEQDSAKINFENPTELDEKIAREIRLRLVPNRTGADKFKKEEKAVAVLLNGIHDGAFKIIENTSKLLENKLEQVEKQREIKRKAEIEVLRSARNEEIKPYGENYTAMDLGNMGEEMYQSILNGAKLNHEAKIKAELELEAARIEKQKQDAIEAENKRIEMERLRKENEQKEKQLELERIEAKKKQDAIDAIRKKRNEELKPYIIFIRDYNALLNASDSEYEKQLKEIQQAAIDQAAYDAKAKQLQFEKELKEQQELAEQKAKADKLAAELQAKVDLEAKVKADQLAAEKKAAKAPDKEKIRQVAMQLGVVLSTLPVLKTEEGNAIITQIKGLIEKTIKYSQDKAETL